MAISKIPSAGFQDNVKFRNIIINGDMSIAQRGTSASSITSPTYATVDRWRTVVTTLGTWTQSQETDVPSGQGFAKSLKMDCTTADASPSASDKLYFLQRFEGQNLQYLEKGTSSAKSLTASFWVKSNKTGTYICELLDNDNSDRHINKSYTINSANTWEKKTITFAGDTTGTLDNDNNGSLFIQFWLGAGSTYTSGTLQTSWGASINANRAVGQVNLADSTDNEWYITGVQLEAGEVASDFEFLPVDVNLQRCNRYYFNYTLGYLGGIGKKANTGSSFSDLEGGSFPCEMRANPSVTFGTPTYENCSSLSVNPANGKTFLARVTASGTYRCYETDVKFDAEL
jgi:hypothetical protein